MARVSFYPAVSGLSHMTGVAHPAPNRYHLFWGLYGFVTFVVRNRLSLLMPRVKAFLAAVRTDPATAALPLGLAGFCWGGKVAVLVSHDEPGNRVGSPGGRPPADAVFAGHPSALSLPADAERVRLPASFAVGDRDAALSPTQVERIRAIVEDDGNDCGSAKCRGEVRLYPGVGHGFCVRADITTPDVAQQANEAEDQAIEWFNKQFRAIAGKVAEKGGLGSGEADYRNLAVASKAQ